jgi:prepilin-type N-terminal cleavage/methylation domain-containing protein
MSHTKKLSHKAFTLVELIVVIVILSILSTIAFLSFSSQSSSARDSVRMTDITNIAQWVAIFNASSSKYPLPDRKVKIMSWSTLLGYQWEAWETIIRDIKWSAGSFKDPLDNTYYTYNNNSIQSKFQVLAFLENNNGTAMNLNPFEGFWSSYATEYDNRYPFVKGDWLWIIVISSGSTDTPLQDITSYSWWSIDVSSWAVTTNTWIVAFLDNSNTPKNVNTSTLIWYSIEDLGDPVDWSCWTASGSRLSTLDWSNLCWEWTASWVDLTWTDWDFNWICKWSNWWVDSQSCSANKFVYALDIGSNWSEMEWKIAADKLWNVYMLWSYQGSTWIDFWNNNITRVWGNDAFLVKYDNTWKDIFAKNITWTWYHQWTDVIVDADWNVVVAWFYSYDLDLWTRTLPWTNWYDSFVITYNSAGTLLSAVSYPWISIMSMAVDKDWNIVYTWHFWWSSVPIGWVPIISVPWSYDFVFKTNKAWNVLWAKWFWWIAIDTDTNWNIYVAGYMESKSLTIWSTTLTNNYVFVTKQNAIFFKLDSSWNPLWAKWGWEFEYDDYWTDIKVDNSWNVYVTWVENSPSFSFWWISLATRWQSDWFFWKYDTDWNEIFLKDVWGWNDDRCMSVDLDSTGNAFIGWFSFPATVNFWTHSLVVPWSHTYDYVVKYDTTWNDVWANFVAISSSDGLYIYTHELSVDIFWNVFVSWMSSWDMNIGWTVLTNLWSYDTYLVKYNNNGGL